MRVVFTDLDESLLERRTYSLEPAREALAALRERKVPVVFCTSKTRAETEPLRRAAQNADPFIVENGGGIYVPEGYFGGQGQTRIALGEDYGRVLEGMGHLKAHTHNSIRGFDDLSAHEIAAETGLTPEMARLAKMREFDEPFKFVRREGEFRLLLDGWVHQIGLRLTRGGRYYHLHGAFDKGQAVRRLIAMYRRQFGAVETLGIGDSQNDLHMLLEVNRPIAVAHEDGTFDATLCESVPRLERPLEPGPRGWAAAVRKWCP